MRKSLLLLLLTISFSFAFVKDTYRCKVDRIVDGDTIYAYCDINKNGIIDKNERVKIRIVSIDTFESKLNRRARLQSKKYNIPISQVIANGLKAKEILKGLLPHNSIFYCNYYGKGRYGRLLCDIVTEKGINVSEYMVCNGYAFPFMVRKEHKRKFKFCKEGR